MKEKTKNILGVMVFLLIELIGIVLINYRVGQQNAEVETTASNGIVSNYTNN